MRKNNKTYAILNEHFANWRDGFTASSMTIANVLQKGFLHDEIPTKEDIIATYCELEAKWEAQHAKDEAEGKHYFRMISFDFEREVTFATWEIIARIKDRTISYGDFLSCAREFYKEV